jgi:predicted alpha-1,6-mannanase (GH76 family)
MAVHKNIRSAIAALVVKNPGFGFCSIITFFIFITSCNVGLAFVSAAPGGPSSPAGIRAYFMADHLASCAYSQSSGLMIGDELWQVANTLEGLANLDSLRGKTRWSHVYNNTFSLTPAIVDNCYDDHQWWLLFWSRAYDATGLLEYGQRAAEIFDNTTALSWNASVCGGGVKWCPSGVYKNAITNELYFASAMALHPHAAALGKPTNFYLDWAQQEWNWFESSGMIDPSTNLINDGLNVNPDGSCTNNGQTTWTYNQGVLLSGLARLSAATGNLTLLEVGKNIVTAVINELTDNNILIEPCNGNCDGDQEIFKGIFARHLSYFMQILPPSAEDNVTDAIRAWVLQNAVAMQEQDYCPNQGYGISWEGPCSNPSTPTDTAAVDLLTAAAMVSSGVVGETSTMIVEEAGRNVSKTVAWTPIGLGNCVDKSGNSMANCYQNLVNEAQCREKAFNDPLAVGYDMEVDCLGIGFCRVRTLSSSGSCGGGWSYAGGSATTITGGDDQSLAICVLKQVQ